MRVPCGAYVCGHMCVVFRAFLTAWHYHLSVCVLLLPRKGVVFKTLLNYERAAWREGYEASNGYDIMNFLLVCLIWRWPFFRCSIGGEDGLALFDLGGAACYRQSLVFWCCSDVALLSKRKKAAGAIGVLWCL